MKPQAKPEDEAAIDNSYEIVSPFMKQLISRTYEKPYKWYLVVFKPYDKQYDKHFEWYQTKAMEYIRRLYSKIGDIVISKEIMAKKTHFNMIIVTCECVDDSETPNHKFKLNVNELEQMNDRLAALVYILKEAKLRPFVKFVDYNLCIRA